MENLLQHVLYINLNDRKDRLKHVIEELEKIGITNPERFPAVKVNAGNIGCTLSHICCIKLAKSRGWPQVFICEDDISFINPNIFCNSLKQFVEYDVEWNVLVIGGNNAPPFVVKNEFCARVMNIQTTTGYIVKQEYYDVLLTNFEEGLKLLMQDPIKNKYFSIDIYWKILQCRDQWYCLLPLTVIQYADYSDIEKRVVNYENVMVNFEKNEMIQHHISPTHARYPF
jgi:GR25 family glycosyltransferase involved in LPS biosynthesis